MTSKGSLVSLAIVGARFRPPAAGLLGVLPAGASLLVRREPDNQYDVNALQVVLPVSTLQIKHNEGTFSLAIPKEQIQSACEGFGFSVDDILAQPEWHLGYVPRTDAELLAPSFDSEGVKEVSASLTFDLQGRPCVSFQVPG